MNRLRAMAVGGLRLAALLGVVVAGPTCAWAGAGELALLGVRQVTGPLTQALQKFERETGQPVAAHFTSPARLRTMTGAVDHQDLVVASDEDMEALEKAGALDAGSRVPLGRIGEKPDGTCYVVAVLAEASNKHEARGLIRYLPVEQAASCSH